MRRIFDYDVVEKYADLCPIIAKYCKAENDYDYDIKSEENFQYDFDDGFVCFVRVGHVYFASCGFLEGSDTFKNCKDAIKDFKENTKHIDNFPIYAKVKPENKRSSALICAIGFEQAFKLYKFGDN